MISRRVLVWTAMAGCLLALAWGLWPAGGEPVPVERPIAFSIPDGADRVYRLEWHGEALVTLGEGDAPPRKWTLDGEGRLYLKYFAATNGWDVAARLDVTSRLDGAPAAIGPGLERPFSFRQDRRGYTSGFAFAPGLPEETRVLARQLVSRLQVALSGRGAEAWRTRERDGIGLFRAAYARDPADALALRKEKLEYLPEDEAGAVREVLRSEGLARLLPDGAGVAEVRIDETVRAREDGVGLGEETLRFEARLVEAEAAGFGGLARFADLAGERDRPFVAPARAAADPTPAPPSLQDALAAFGASFEGDRAGAEAAVLAWLRSGAGAPGELVRWLDSCSRGRESMDPARQAVLYRLLAEAGTPAAIEALVLAASDRSFEVRTRRLAIGHMGAVKAADPRQVEALFDLHAGDGGDGGELERMALLAAGALGHRELASDAIAARVADELGARYRAAADPAGRVEVLGAMGNSGDARLVPTIGEALATPDPAVRAAAARALRRVDGDEVAPLLMRQYAEDPDPGVRAAVVETLGRRPPSDETLSWARAEALQARDEATQLALVDLLGGSLETAPANAETLRRLLASGPGMRVERRVLRYVAPR